MADAVAPRDWRRRKHTVSTHTETRVESLPQEVQELLLEMADRIRTLETRQHEMRSELDAFGQVTGNDLLKRSA